MTPAQETPAEIPEASRDVYSVSRLNAEARALLEGGFPLLWIEGEISNLAQPGSGHVYFSLKDMNCQVRCAMFRSRVGLLNFKPANGQHVLVRARVSLYEGRGEFQLIVEYLEPLGEGALRLAFERLKQKLAAEGLFAADRKRELPGFPRSIGVITSPTGAAIRDILHVLERRAPFVSVVIYPVPVQGEAAAPAIARAIALADIRADCDVLILARGGGSLEDLWAFNDEGVARAIHACRLPLITGIGHEIDFTIADFVADRRAPTPSAAAELLSPDGPALTAALAATRVRLQQTMSQILARRRDRFSDLQNRLVSPVRRLEERGQRLDELNTRLRRAVRTGLENRRLRLRGLEARLLSASPSTTLQRHRTQLAHLDQALQASMQTLLHERRSTLRLAWQALHARSPLATLARGYAIVNRTADAEIVHRVRQLKVGDGIAATFTDGRALCEVQEVIPEDIYDKNSD
jgi:exodeoxyribonuclease VII large subunit